MKKLLAITFCALILFCSCGRASVLPASEFISLESYPDTVIELPEGTQNLAICENLAFSQTDTDICRIDLLTGEQHLLNIKASAIGCDTARLFAISNGELCVYSHSGELLSSHELETDISQCEIYADGNTVLIVSHIETNKGLQSELYLYDLDKNELSELGDSYRQNDSYGRIYSASLKDGKAYIVYAYKQGGLANGPKCKAIVLDVKSNTVESLTELGENSNAVYDADSYVYYNVCISMTNRIMRLSPDGSTVLLHIVPKNTYNGAFVSSRLYKFGDNYALARLVENKLLLTHIPKFDRTLTVLIPEDMFRFDFESHLMQFQAETGIAVQIKYCDAENYSNILNTKLMASDTDFDVFVVDDSTFLANILKIGAYEPLDAISDSFAELQDGCKSLLTYKEGTDESAIFGIPLTISIYSAMAKHADIDISVEPTIEEALEVCASLPEGYALFRDPYTTVRIVRNHLQAQLDLAGDIDTEKLEELLTELYDLNQSGKLFARDAEGNQLGTPVLDYIAAYFSNLDPDFIHHLAPYPEYGLVRFPTDGQNYVDLDACLMLNPSSENKDTAMQYLASIISGETIYNNALTDCQFIGKDVERNSEYHLLGEDTKKYLEFVPTLLENAKPYTLSTEVDDAIREFAIPMYSDEITPADAAEEICKKVRYIYFE